MSIIEFDFAFLIRLCIVFGIFTLAIALVGCWLLITEFDRFDDREGYK